MPYIPKAPAELAHLDDQAVARALSRRFGDVTRAAEDLGVPRSALTRRTWRNPKVLTWAHERIDLFLWLVQDEIIAAFHSPRAKRRQWAIDQLLDGDHPFAPAPRSRAPNPSAALERARLRLEREACAERDMERAAEREREAAAERVAECERSEVMVKRRPSAPPVAPAMSLWPPGIRRPTRGRRWRR
jgi:hypothetical protein